LVIACVDTSNSEELMIAVSVGDVSNRISLHREQVRRALSKLREKGLARNMSGQWIFTDDAFQKLK
jgi:predicted transcriptional regulator of viral defense system